MAPSITIELTTTLDLNSGPDSDNLGRALESLGQYITATGQESSGYRVLSNLDGDNLTLNGHTFGEIAVDLDGLVEPPPTIEDLRNVDSEPFEWAQRDLLKRMVNHAADLREGDPNIIGEYERGQIELIIDTVGGMDSGYVDILHDIIINIIKERS